MTKVTKTKEEKEVKVSAKKQERIDAKKAKKLQREAIIKEQIAVEEKIDALIKEKKATKDKTKKKEIKNEIKKQKAIYSNIGKKDTFFGDVKAEMKLVRWPNKMEMLKFSIATLVFIIFFALFFLGIDGLSAFIKELFN